MKEILRWMKEAVEAIRPNVCRFVGAAAGAAAAWYTGLPPIGQALLIAQGADVLTGVLAALCRKSPKSPSGKLSSSALAQGVVKKGLEWLVVFICLAVGSALEMQSIAASAMTYMIAAELVSLMENLNLFGLKIPMLQSLLDAANKNAG